jgi:signal transduction histidine kinase/DNA-binding response OmpR family regulator
MGQRRVVFRGDGRLSRDLQAVNWSATPLGPPDDWDHGLIAMVNVVISSRFSMWMAWGPELTFFCNDAYRGATLGAKYPWALGRPAREVWAEIWDEISPRIERVMRTGEATWDRSLLLFLERSGYVEESYHTFSYSPLTDQQGDIAGMLCVVSEETERVVGERRMTTLRDLGAVPMSAGDEGGYLRAAARHLAADPRSLPFTACYLFDDQGSARLASTSGIAPGHAAAPLAVDPSDPAPVWPVAELLAGQSVTVEALGERFGELPTGGWPDPPEVAVTLPLPAQAGDERPTGFLVVGLNRYRPLDDGYRSFLRLVAGQLGAGVASVRAYAAERRRAEQLAELDRAKTAFFTNISHELRTPLTLLLGPAEDALLSADLSDTERHRMEMIARNAQRLLRLVGSLLDFARLESGRMSARFEPIDLARYTAELASMFTSAIESAGLRFEIDCPPLPEPVYVDRDMWSKIVLNLLSNALKFTLEGSIALALHPLEGGVRLSVADTGIGIPREHQERLFERFQRVEGSAGRTHEGAGIGLALVSELAKLHGGRTTLDSAPGEGSTFGVEVPFGARHLPADQIVVDGAGAGAADQLAAGFVAEARRWDGHEPSARPARHSSPSDRPLVLVVDDSADMRDYVSSLLADSYLVETAVDGEQALEMIRRRPPDLVLSDVMMPRLDGFGLLSALRGDLATVGIPVVMLSARAGEEGIVEGLEAGADDYLIKPFSGRELKARINTNLELDRVRRLSQQLERSLQIQNQAERLGEVGSWEIELPSGRVHASDNLLSMVQLERPEFDRMDFEGLIDTLIHPDDREALREALRATMQQGVPVRQDARLVSRDGHERSILVRGEAVTGPAGAVSLRGFIQDVSRQREAERAIADAAAARDLAAFEHSVADELQQSLLPKPSFTGPRLEVASFYQAGVAGTRAGGDFYDMIDLGAGRTALTIGDVAGRGVAAASMMGQLRAAIHAYAWLGLRPGELLDGLDGVVQGLRVGSLVTCVFGIFDSSSGEFVYAGAGHLPVIVVTPEGEPRRLPGATGPPLGAGFTNYGEQRVVLSAGSRLGLYTDGLVERRRGDLDENIDRAARELAAAVPLEALPNRLVAALGADNVNDDVAVLIARVTDDPPERVVEVDLAAEAASVRQAREVVRGCINDWGVPDPAAGDAVLVVSELVTNGLLHGRPPIGLRVRHTGDELVIEVRDSAIALPKPARFGSDHPSGRGLAVVARLASRWGARAEDTGKVVWATFQLAGLHAREH